jgi:hypothetical protein
MCQKWLQSVGWRRPHRWVKYKLTNFFSLYITLPNLTLPYLFSCKPLQPKRLNRFVRMMAQTTRFAVRKCFLGVALIGNYISGSKTPREPQISEPGRKISSQIKIHTNNFWTVRHRRKILNGQPIQTRGRRIERWRNFCFRTLPSGRSDFKTVKIANNLRKVGDRRKMTM